jgi:MFS family permease
VSDPDGSPPAHLQRDDPEALLDERSDPGGLAFGALGLEASSELNWLKLLRHRVQRRAMGSTRYQWWVLWSLLAGLLALNFTFTVFNVDLVHVAAQLHTQTDTLLWTTVGPTLAYGLAAPVFGKIGDIFGHRRLYLFGLIGGMASAILTALAPTVGMLILARTLDGVQGAATGTASGALLNLTFSKEERVKAAGWWSFVGAGGPVIGVSLGAPIIALWGWRALFWVQLGLLVVACSIVAVILPQRVEAEEEAVARRDRARREFRTMDWIGSWTISASITALMLGITFSQHSGWVGVRSDVCWVVAVGAMAAFVYRINHTATPLIPVHYFRRRNFVWPMIVRAGANFGYFGGFFLSSLLLQEAFGKSTPQVGAIVIARPIAFAISSPIAGYLTIRIGERVSALAGGCFLVLSMLTFATLSPSSGDLLIIVALALSGLAMGVAMPATGSTMANEVDPKEFGVMTAAQLLTGQAGQVVGQGIMVTLQADRLAALPAGASPSEILGTYRTSFFVGAGVSTLAIVGSLFFRPLPRDRLRGDLPKAQDHSL